MLEQEFQWYLKNQGELAKKYLNKFIVIKGHEVIGVYDSNLDALSETKKKHQMGTFLIQQCTPGQEVQTFYSNRVAFK